MVVIFDLYSFSKLVKLSNNFNYKGTMTEKDDNQDSSKYFVVTDVLDLHGFFPEQVSEVVQEFIRNARELKLHRVQIIHGKGKSKMKYLVRKELASHPNVVAFGDATPESGGWGRTIVELSPAT